MKKASITRKTKETNITLNLNLKGTGRSKVSTGVAFFDHMLTLFAHHSMFDLDVKAKGDIEVDCHHTVEDVGICIGEAIKKCLGDKKGIARYGSFTLPMDETLVLVSLDMSGRPYLGYKMPKRKGRVGNFDMEMVEEFYRAVANHAGMTLHVQALAGSNLHHLAEATFKAFGRALAQAVKVNPQSRKIPSSKGIL